MKLQNSDKQYEYAELLESQVDKDPFAQFGKWFQDADNRGIKYPNAFVLATSTPDGIPNARYLLLKDFSEKGFVFYTNEQSVKGAEIKNNPYAYMVFWWDVVERQVRISGKIESLSDSEANEYFTSRPRGSQIGAWASKQSTVIESRDILENSYKEFENKYEGADVPRPPYWRGYRLVTNSIEFWQGRPDRLHDRLRYKPSNDHNWIIERLSP